MLQIDHLTVSYGRNAQPAVADFSLAVEQGKIISLVGESGSGKTTVIRSVMGLLPAGGRITAGNIRFQGQSLLEKGQSTLSHLRGVEIAMIFQDCGNMLNPIRKIGNQFAEYIMVHRHISKKEAWEKGKSMLERMGLPNRERIMNSYPFHLSGGQRQRVGIAMAMVFEPKLLLADEPTSALDVTTQAQIVEEMMTLRDDYGTAIVMVTHNLGIAAYMSDEIVVMKNSRIVETGTRSTLIDKAENKYTRTLLAAIPQIGGNRYV